MTGVEKFGDPFLLPSWQVMPDNLRSLFDVCRFLYIRCPEFAQAGKKLMSYFITDVEFGETKSGDKNEQIELKEWLHDQVGAFTHQYALGLDWTCFAGETLVTTRAGVFKIKDLVGKRMDVLSKGGIYRPADFKSYGKQSLMEVEFSDGQKVYATPDHQWEITQEGATHTLTTQELLAGHRIALVTPGMMGIPAGACVSVVGVQATDRFEEVYCCTEMSTHTLVVGVGILSKNCYGNAFGRIHRPFNRFLVIPTDNGHAEVSVSEFDNATYNFSTVTYSIDDPTRSHRGGKHRRRISVPFIDRVARDLNRISLQRIDPAYVHLQYSDRSGRCQVVERFAPHLLASIKRGDLFICPSVS